MKKFYAKFMKNIFSIYCS